jgi:hypothetical protein
MSCGPLNGWCECWRRLWPGGANRRRFASTMARNDSPTVWHVGVRTEGLRGGIFSRATRIRMPSSNGSIGPIDTKCSRPMCSSRWIRCARSVRSGCGSTTKSGPMTRWTGCRPRHIGPRSQPEVLLWKCRLDGEAYDEEADLRIVSTLLNRLRDRLKPPHTVRFQL